jgi:histidinol-phosphate aminotransferase
MRSQIRPSIAAMAGYMPGEQPRDGEVLKLNTNESPYPPSPRVFEAIRSTLTGDRLRKYPEALGTSFRETAGRVLNVDPEGIVIGNGSDDILTILTRTFVPEGGLVVSPTPSYLLYRSLAEIQGARFRSIPFADDWSLTSARVDADIFFLSNPNSPSGTMLTTSDVRRLAAEVRGPLVADEAYADFAGENALDLVRSPDSDVIVTRSLSKSYCLAGIRFGFAVTSPEIARELIKVKDSYNCDVLSLAAARAAIEDQEYLRSTYAKIVATRTRLQDGLKKLGFVVTPSRANFVWCRRTDRPVKPIYEELKRRAILIRYMMFDDYGDGLRISVGTDVDIDRVLGELKSILDGWDN